MVVLSLCLTVRCKAVCLFVSLAVLSVSYFLSCVFPGLPLDSYNMYLALLVL